MTITHFSIEYDAINDKNTFTNGDTINGRIVVEVSRETTVKLLTFFGQGRAEVRWSEHYGQHRHVYRAVEKYYDVKRLILREARQDGTEVLGRGRHVFPFSFKIPDRKMPPSFQDGTGKVVHKLKAELKQSMKLTQKTKTHFTFVSKADMDIPRLMEPQYGCKNKPIKVFGSGAVSLNVHTMRMGYEQGQDVDVVLDVINNSTRPVRPKLTLYEKKSYIAQGKRRVRTNDVLRETFEVVPSSNEDTVTKVITIPGELPPSILNCSILKREYRLKISLDIKWASDPEIKLPIVVLPASAEQQPPHSAGFGCEAFGSPNQTAWSATSRQQQAAAPGAVDPPPAYGAHALYPPFYHSGQYRGSR